MNGITDRPNEYGFGHDFNYDAWTNDTELVLCSVPWGNDYRDVLEKPLSEINAWIDARSNESVKIEKFQYVAPNTPIRIATPFNVAAKYNYIRVRNPLQPVSGDVTRDFFYFILDVQRVNAGTTEIMVQLDVWTTYRHDVRFERGFVERGHVGIANTANYAERGRRYLTVPEGFDTGSDYQIVGEREAWKSNASNMFVVITSTTDLTQDPGDANNPKLSTAPGGLLQALATATSSYILRYQDMASYFSAMRGYPWITQGIVSVTVVPNLRDFGYDIKPVPRSNNYPPGPSGSGSSYLNIHGSYSMRATVGVKPQDLIAIGTASIPKRYSHLNKFKTSPYMVIEVSNLMGSNGSYKPELFAQGDSTSHVYLSIIPGGERLEFVPGAYNSKPGLGLIGEGFDASVVTGALINLPVVNDMAISSLASSVHSRTAARGAADWSQQLALDSNAVALENSVAGAKLTHGNEAALRDLSDKMLTMDHASAQVEQTHDMYRQVAGGAIGGAISMNGKGGVGGAGAAAAGGAIAGLALSHMDKTKMVRLQAVDLKKQGTSNRAMAAMSNRNMNHSTSLSESNKALADRAAKGGYEQAIGAMNARVQDTMLTQPGMSGGYGGEFLRFMTEGFTFVARVRMIDEASIVRIGEHWLRYGYAVREFMKLPSNLLVMNRFSYWKLSEVYMTNSHVPELFKRTLAGILEKGVTVWANPDDIGTADTGNNPAKPNTTIER